MAFLLLLGLLSVSAAAVHAQDSTQVVRVQVLDSRTGERIRMATVEVGPRIADSDSTGISRLCRLAPGRAAVRVRATGYKEGIFPVVVGAQDSTTVLIRAEPAPPGAGIRMRFGHGLGPDSHRAIMVVDGDRVFFDPTGCATSRAGERRVDSLSAEDVESVEVLKGPAAVQRFGPVAQHGAVLITTKRARPPTQP